MSARDRLWRVLADATQQTGGRPPLRLYYRGEYHLRLDVAFVGTDPWVRVTDDLLLLLRKVEKHRPKGRGLGGWENYAERLRANAGGLVSLSTATQAVLVPLASPERSTLNVNVFRELHFKLDELSKWLPRWSKRIEGDPTLPIDKLAESLFASTKPSAQKRDRRRSRQAPAPSASMPPREAVRGVRPVRPSRSGAPSFAADDTPPYSKPARSGAGHATRAPIEQSGKPTRRAAPNEPITLFSWLHLSDLHFGHGSSSHGWDQVLVTQAIIRDAAGLPREGAPRPDAVLVTGDIAFSGDTRPHGRGRPSREYNDARDFLRELAEAVHLDPDRIYLVPGNHDVQRSADAERSVARLIARLRDGKELLDEALADPEDRALLARRQARFLSFAAEFAPAHLAKPSPVEKRLWWSHRTSVRGLHIRLVGLNTCLLCANDEDHSRLALGKEPLVQVLAKPPTQPEELVVVLSHHPLRGGWLTDEREADAWMSRHAHVHLHGHIHEAASEETRGGAGGSLIRLAAGAAHHEESAPPSHGYNAAAVLRFPDGTLALRVWPRRWSSRNKDFRLDVDNVPRGQGFAEHAIRLNLPAARAERASNLDKG